MRHLKTLLAMYILNFKENTMKKLLAIILATLSLSVSAQKETITLAYSWTAS
jgi:hypothetical protein